MNFVSGVMLLLYFLSFLSSLIYPPQGQYGGFHYRMSDLHQQENAKMSVRYKRMEDGVWAL